MDFFATLGAACAEQKTLSALFDEGMTAARINLSHTTLPACAPLLERFFAAAAAAGVSPRLVADMQGPELRVGLLEKPAVLLEGREALLGAGGIPVPQSVVDAAQVGERISLDDSALLLEVAAKEEDALRCVVRRGGTLLSRKSLAVLGREIDAPALTDADRAALHVAGQYGVTDVLQPFVRGAEDVRTVRQALDWEGLSSVRVMAKIENRRGVAHLDGILASADEICIARGDLGNAMPLWELPRMQKEIARRCRAANRPFCVATQLLWSMESRAVPTRAEVLDIYNAVLDGASGLMLTGETAAGRYPVEAMRYLVRTARSAIDG
ncbi:MAG: pyruvate kinase [Oscillospiraceae bacterium]|nr:pyruvate kinase [Oscillospiraceae bacterium]